MNQYKPCVTILFPLETYKPIKYFTCYTIMSYTLQLALHKRMNLLLELLSLTNYHFYIPVWGTVSSLEHKCCQDWNKATYRGTMPYRLSKKATEEWHGQSIGIFWIEMVFTRDDCIKWLCCFLFLEGNPTMLKWCPACCLADSVETNKA